MVDGVAVVGGRENICRGRGRLGDSEDDRLQGPPSGGRLTTASDLTRNGENDTSETTAKKSRSANFLQPTRQIDSGVV